MSTPKGTVTVRTLRDMLDRLCQSGMANLPVIVGCRNRSLATNLHSSQLIGGCDDLCLWLFGDHDPEMDQWCQDVVRMGVSDKMPVILWEDRLAYLNCDGPEPQPKEW